MLRDDVLDAAMADIPGCAAQLSVRQLIQTACRSRRFMNALFGSIEVTVQGPTAGDSTSATAQRGSDG